jgi:hypothetical protein
MAAPGQQREQSGAWLEIFLPYQTEKVSSLFSQTGILIDQAAVGITGMMAVKVRDGLPIRKTSMM